MNYDLFLSDFDGTLVRADGTISKRNIEAIARYRRAGGVFAVVTGRMLSSILPRLRELGLGEGLAVAYQGGVIADIATGRLLKRDAFSPSEAVNVLTPLEADGEHIHVYSGEVLYANRSDEMLRLYEKICGVRGTVPKEPLSEFVTRRGEPVEKILVMIEPPKRDALLSRLRELFPQLSVTASSPWLAEILPAGVSKAQAVEFLSEYYHVPREKIAAAGDQLNDLPMLEAAGGKFAVANAEQPLKAISVVVPSCEEDGVAVAIGKYAMGDLK